MSHFSSKLLTWYDESKRDLPWRHTKDPYKIWVSEIMLQQTQAVTVMLYYERFINTLSDIRALAEADEALLLKLWEGLGYYSRVRNMQATARVIMEKYDGIIPNTKASLMKLKGIGPYTAGAIASIAFDQKASAIDGNVSRVLARYALIEDSIDSNEVKKKLEEINLPLIDDDRPADYTQAMIELGATVCRKSQPLCDICPINQDCKAYKEQKQSMIPVKDKKNAKKNFQYITFVLEDEDGNLILLKQENRLLNGLFLLPQIEAESIHYAITSLEEYGYVVNNYEPLGHYRHVFTHMIWEMDVYYVKVIKPSGILSFKDYKEVAIATAHKQILDKINRSRK